ncbi:MAG: hypothetical protein FWF77_02065 [Defluviitaleaceae bacterium]|nr:hypothetical protein [Defluviitaleaceae bacterium]
MLATSHKETSVKYTTVLPKVYIDEMKSLADKKIVPSVSQGIRLAIEDFIEFQKQLAYANSLKDATGDNAFINRTMDTQNDFSVVDNEGVSSW